MSGIRDDIAFSRNGEAEIFAHSRRGSLLDSVDNLIAGAQIRFCQEIADARVAADGESGGIVECLADIAFDSQQRTRSARSCQSVGSLSVARA